MREGEEDRSNIFPKGERENYGSRVCRGDWIIVVSKCEEEMLVLMTERVKGRGNGSVMMERMMGRGKRCFQRVKGR